MVLKNGMRPNEIHSNKVLNWPTLYKKCIYVYIYIYIYISISRHYNKCPSSQPAGYEGLEISILSFIKNPANSKVGQIERDREEKRWIHRLATVVPKGLNLMD